MTTAWPCTVGAPVDTRFAGSRDPNPPSPTPRGPPHSSVPLARIRCGRVRALGPHVNRLLKRWHSLHRAVSPSHWHCA
uniref:Uncharacterized protein n=1 Tax=Leersia perrieri TaxID=77586 RepID=A0A0D9W7J0_9ORYZ